ncbi:hypothetical protein PUR_16140 [Paenibacillus sp. URB8-2]|nr:hypothetical protein PUR_16140 [Paenibacillus sp. URB8-2]
MVKESASPSWKEQSESAEDIANLKNQTFAHLKHSFSLGLADEVSVRSQRQNYANI